MKTSTAPSSHDTLLLDHFLSLLLLSPLSATVKRWCLYEFARAAIAKDHRVRGLNYRNSIFSQFWRLEAWFQGVGGVGFFWGVSPRFADGCLLPRFADGCLLPLLHTDRLASVCVCVLGALLLRTLVILRSTRMTSFYLNHLFKGPISKNQSHSEVLEIRTINYKCWGDNEVKSWLIGKDPDAGKDWGQEEKGTTEGEMVGWHHWLDGLGFEWTPGIGDGRPGVLQFIGSQRVRHDWATELNWTGGIKFSP